MASLSELHHVLPPNFEHFIDTTTGCENGESSSPYSIRTYVNPNNIESESGEPNMLNEDFLEQSQGDDSITQAMWKQITGRVKLASPTLCKNTIPSDYFTELHDSLRCNIIIELCFETRPFAFILGEYRDFTNDYPKTFYIDVICANTDLKMLTKERRDPDQILHVDSGGQRIPAGKILLNYCLNLCKKFGFNCIQLSALSYVINYYRRFGFRHIKSCDEQENEDIKELAEKNKKRKFKDENDVDDQIRIEHAINISNGTANRDIFGDNLKEYLKGSKLAEDIVGFDDLTNDELLENPEINKILTEFENIPGLKQTGKGGFFDLMLKLHKKGFSVECSEGKKTERTWLEKDEDGDFEQTCIDEGFTMRLPVTQDTRNFMSPDSGRSCYSLPEIISFGGGGKPQNVSLEKKLENLHQSILKGGRSKSRKSKNKIKIKKNIKNKNTIKNLSKNIKNKNKTIKLKKKNKNKKR
jgi:hypothetical protein